MYRKESSTIKEWLENSNNALLITGARQIGKTWLIRDVIDNSELNRFEINFIDQPNMIEYLNAKMSAEDFLVKLKMISLRILNHMKQLCFLMKFKNVQK